MMRYSTRILLTIGGVLLLSLGLTSQSQAQVIVRAPFVYVQTGRPTVIRAPFVQIVIAGRPAQPLGFAPSRSASAPTPGQPSAERADDPPAVPNEVPRRLVPEVGRSTPSEVPEVPGSPAPQTLPAPSSALTVKEFMQAFRAAPRGGKYTVLFRHPFTGRPIEVPLTLPTDRPQRVRGNRQRLEFHYGPGRIVVVQFLRNGSVQVTR